MVYQADGLNPAMRVGRQLTEVPILHENASKDEAYDRALEMMKLVRLPTRNG